MNVVQKTLTFLILAFCVSCGTASTQDESQTDEPSLINSAEASPASEGDQKPDIMITPKEVADQIETLKREDRFVRLQEALQRDHDLQLNPLKAEGAIFPEGKVLMIPLMESEKGSDAGYVVISEAEWAVAIDRKKTDTPPEGYLFEKDKKDGKLTLKDALFNEQDHEHPGMNDFDPSTFDVNKSSDAVTLKAQNPQWGCQYVSSIGFHWSCIDLDDNPFGYRYTLIGRIGYGSYSTPNWWACTYGFIHVCPLYEESWSPVTATVCGFPPNHWAGG